MTMRKLDRRDFLKIMGLGAGAAAIPAFMPGSAFSANGAPEGFYDLPMKGNARLLHITDVHGQLKPVYFREPNVNLGVADAYGRPPHLVGKKLLKAMGLKEKTILILNMMQPTMEKQVDLHISKPFWTA
jgi:sulfur-oxidizing protein SoxB